MLWLLGESTSFLGFEHPIGGSVSILGAFLLGIGFVGKRRLERWDEAVGRFVERMKTFRQRCGEIGLFFGRMLVPLFERFDPLVKKWYNWIVGFTILIVLLVALLLFIGRAFAGHHDNWAVIAAVWTTAAFVWLASVFVWAMFLCIILIFVLFLLAVVIPLLVRVPSVLVWICMTPYFLARRLEKDGALERMFVLIGTIMGAVGIGMCLWKGP
jgi:hypothetical protein